MLKAKELELILRAWEQPEFDGIDELKQPYWGRGCLYQQRRLQIVAMLYARDFPGDLIEIGCLNGSTTVVLAEIAKLYNRRVIAVDPWDIGIQQCETGTYEQFAYTIRDSAKMIDVIKASSLEPSAIEQIKNRELCFAYVDGLHTYDACLSDIRTCWHSPVICVDDTWEPDVIRAVDDTIGNRIKIEVKPLHELYIV